MKDHKEFIKGVGMILIGIVGFLVLFSYSDLEIRDYSGEGKVGEAFRIGFGGLTGRVPGIVTATPGASKKAGGATPGLTTTSGPKHGWYTLVLTVRGRPYTKFIPATSNEEARKQMEAHVAQLKDSAWTDAWNKVSSTDFDNYPILDDWQKDTAKNFIDAGYTPVWDTMPGSKNYQLQITDPKAQQHLFFGANPGSTATEAFQFQGSSHKLDKIPVEWRQGNPYFKSIWGGNSIRITKGNLPEMKNMYLAETQLPAGFVPSEYNLVGYVKEGALLRPVLRELSGTKKYYTITTGRTSTDIIKVEAKDKEFLQRTALNSDPTATVFLYRPQKVSSDGSELEDAPGAPYLEVHGVSGTKHFIDPRFAAEIAKSGSKNKDFSGLEPGGGHRIVIKTSETKTTEFVLPPESKPNGIQIREEHQEFKDEIHNKPVDIILRASSIQPATSTTPLVEGSTQFKPVFIGPDGRHLSLAQAKRLKKADVKFDYVATQQIFLERASPDSDVERSVTVSYTQRRQKVAGKDDQYFKIATVGEAISGSGFLGANKYEAKYIIMPGKDFDPSKLTMVGGVLKYDNVDVTDTYNVPDNMLVAIATKDGGLFTKATCNGCNKKQLSIARTMMRQAASRQLFQRMDFALTSMSGLQGFSTLMYGKEEMAKKRQDVDVAFCETLGGFAGGTDCWTSKICSSKVDKVSDGTLLMEVPGGMLQPVAHVEASRQVIQFQNATGFFEEYIYKISFNVDNPDYWRWGYHGEGEGLFFQVFLFPRAGGQPVPLLSADNPERRVDPGDETNRGGDDILVLPSKTSYDRICLNFMEKSGKPKKLILGIGGDKEEESEVCNIINDVTPNFDFIPPGAAPFVPGNQVIPGINPI